MEFNTLHEMIAVLQAFSDGDKIEHKCIVEDKKACHLWIDIRTDMKAHELFDFQFYAYRVAA